MGQEDNRVWSQSWSAAIGKNIQRTRKSVGMSAAQVSEACERLGYSIPRSTIANLEAGRKEAMPVHEIVVLGEAMGVPPMQLLYPIDSSDTVQYLPGQTVSPHEAWSRFSRGLHTADLPLEINDALRTPEKVEAILTAYARLAEVVRFWNRFTDASNAMGALGARGDASRKAMQGEMEHAALESLEECRALDQAGLPWPTLPEGLAAAIHKAERAQRDGEPVRDELEVDTKTARPLDAGWV